MAIGPIQSSTPVPQSPGTPAPAKSAAKPSSPLPQDKVTLSAAAKAHQPPIVAKDPPASAVSPAASSDGDHDGH